MERDTLREFFELHQSGGLISLAAAEQAMMAGGCSLHEVEDAALAAGYLPRRYERNRNLLSLEDQLKLHRSCVAVVGCGGLGGHGAEMLARCGVGRLICIDPDSFAEHNLNRQRFCTISSLGLPKAQVIAEELRNINPSTLVSAHVEAFRLSRAAELLGPADVVVDALDSFDARAELAAACSALGRPFVHGAIGGWYGQFAMQAAGSNSLGQWLSACRGKSGIDEQLGNPSFTPAFIASLQVAGTIRILLGKDDMAWGNVFFCDLRQMSFDAGSLG
ncbi:MAG: UBA/THIF-type NAD/FAD binding protein [Nitrospirae bacterium]|nr:MAG: UBA/THIF-type NAD/FAD binding protein [Nitrospirota bacterium]